MQDNKYNPNSHSGRFNKRITLYGPVVTQDEIGNEIETFGEICTLWSMVKTTKGTEYFAAAQTNSVNTVRFVVRYSKYLEEIFKKEKSKFEVEYKSVRYDVQGYPINDDELNKTFTIIAEGRM
ncbi:phage head closure protein [Paenibacillus sp. M1]|uniref:Phage head closure protein n=1 Tax=Paenibacillus haidiansis TaxID=1574488 RepID=A0ABU7VNT7_9BACL